MNKTTLILLPLFNINLDKWNGIIKQAYLGDNRFDLTDRQYIFVEVIEDIKTELQIQIEESESFITKYKGDNTWIYVLEIPSIFSIDFDNFLLGKYSSMSLMAKTAILSNCGKERTTVMYRRLNPTEHDIKCLTEYLTDVETKDDVQLRKLKYHKMDVYNHIQENGEVYSKVVKEDEWINYPVDNEFKIGINKLENGKI